MNLRCGLFFGVLVIIVFAASVCIAAVRNERPESKGKAEPNAQIGVWEPNDVVDLLEEATEARQQSRGSGESTQTEGLKDVSSTGGVNAAGGGSVVNKAGGEVFSYLDKVRAKMPKSQVLEPEHESEAAGLFKEYITSASPSQSNSREELEELVKLVRSLKFVERSGGVEADAAAAVKEPGPVVEQPEQTEEIEAAESVPDTSETVETESVAYEAIRAETLRELRALCQEGGEVLNPAAVGRTLFVCGNAGEAAEFYQLALARMKPDGADVNQKERAWVLFQLGNCLYEAEPYSSKAKKTYEEFISEYPSSEWAALAAARVQLIDWYEKDKPQTLTAGLKGNEAALQSKDKSEVSKEVVQGTGNE